MVKNVEIIECAIEQLDKKEPEMIKSMLIQFLKSNLRVPKAKKINMFDYVATGEEAAIRPVVSGVFMDKANKVAVATDGHTIIVSKSEYKPTRVKNGIIDKDGKAVNTRNCKYVKYEYPFQFEEGDGGPIELFDEATIIDSALTTLSENELSESDMCPSIPIASEPDLFFPISRIPLLLEVGLKGWEFHEKVYYYRDDDKRIIVSGVMVK